MVEHVNDSLLMLVNQDTVYIRVRGKLERSGLVVTAYPVHVFHVFYVAHNSRQMHPIFDLQQERH